MNLDKIRARLDEGRGPQYWRSLEEVADTPEFRAFLEDEFPNRMPDWLDPVRRRGFLKVMAASLALAGASACTKQPKETIVPYVKQPPEFVPGKPLFYATAFARGGYATGLLVESHLGRPTKIEGNPDHPASLGACDIFSQASILNLYDPDRAQAVMHRGSISAWGTFIGDFSTVVDRHAKKKGAGLRVLTRSIGSPTLASQLAQLLAAMPQARWHQWDPLDRAGAHAGAIEAFGAPLNTLYRFDRAGVVVSLDSDFLANGPGSLRYARDFASKLRSSPPPRLYAAEGTPSVTGARADHRFRMRTSEVEAFAFALAKELDLPVSAGQATAPVAAVARELAAHKGSSIVIAGDYQPASVHALAHAMNQALGNVGQTVSYTDPVVAGPLDQLQSLGELVAGMRAGEVETLVILDGNPIYDAPADLDFAAAMNKVPLRVHLSTFDNETSYLCHWLIPQAHYLESWSDARAYDGTASIIQPLIAPFYGGKTAHELVSLLQGYPDRSSHDIVKDYWRTQHAGKDFDDFWQISLNNGVVAGTALPPKSVSVPKLPSAGPPAASALELVFRPDPSVGEGEFSNNGWLQELPKPQNKMSWDNAAWVSPATAQRLNVATGDMLELTAGGRSIVAPVWILPGHADNSVSVQLGYGRTRAGRVAKDVGYDAYKLRSSNGLWLSAAGARKVSGSYNFANSQLTQTMEGREPIRLATFAGYAADPKVFDRPDKHVPNGLTLYHPEEFPYTGHKWGMSIDLTSCIGCNACMVACQAENNIAVVGKEQVALGRIMNWIRVDRYYAGKLDDPETYYQPVPCMQCENAPCEVVCPVAATNHSSEGLNQMVYNRCVGTRYCSNNCPYKVRRFNFYLYSDWYTQSLYGVRNPDVTVRSRGVMEKCTYCIQRISRVKIQAEEENNRPIRDGEIVTACQQACPTQAIIFGDMNDPNSRLTKLKKEQRDYKLLEDQNTRPRTTYLGRLRNPNTEIEPPARKEKG